MGTDSNVSSPANTAAVIFFMGTPWMKRKSNLPPLQYTRDVSAPRTVMDRTEWVDSSQVQLCTLVVDLGPLLVLDIAQHLQQKSFVLGAHLARSS